MRRTPSIAAILIALAVMVRIAAILVLRSDSVPRSTYEHGEIAANILAGRGYSIRFLHTDGPTSMQAPVYPLLVTAAFAVGGVDTSSSCLLIQLAQAGLGGILVGATIGLTRRLVPHNERLALLAGLAVAVYPTLVYAATHVQVALLAATLLNLALWLACRAGETGRPCDAILAGLCLGLLVLTDPILGLVAPGMAWSVQQRTKLWPRLVLILASTSLATVAPWIARNQWVHGEFVPVKSTFGYAFWQGNCDLSLGTDKVARPSVEAVLANPEGRNGGLRAWNRTLWAARHEAGYIDDIALTPADYAVLSRLNEPGRSRWLLSRALSELAAQPGRYTQLCLSRLRAFFLFDESNPKSRSQLYRASHLALTGLALVGLLLLRRPHDWRAQGPALLTVSLIATFHVLTIVSARFHIPVEPLMAIWAAIAVDRAMTALSALATRFSPIRPLDQPRRLTTSNVSGS
jgi:hypothetical protein